MYLERLKEEGLSEKTIRGYRYALKRAWMALPTRPMPSRLTEFSITALSTTMASDPWLLRTLNVCLKAMGCRYALRFSIPPRSRVSWLDPHQANVVMDTALGLGPPHSAVVHLELENGFRRISVIRAQVGDFARTPIYVRGKGHDYTMWPHPRLAQVCQDTMAWRESMDFSASTSLIPARSRRRHNSVGPYSERGIDGILQRVATESGVSFSHHTLRRTFGRSLWKCGVPIETVSEMLGHQSIDQTRLYIGVNLSDMAEAMRKLSEYQAKPIVTVVK